MAKTKTTQLTILSCLLFLTCLFVHSFDRTPKNVQKPFKLEHTFGPLRGYSFITNTPLSEDLVSFLKLDDYIQSSYEKNGVRIDLYIGYYNNLNKISAAHSPLQCFPGQGWEINTPKQYKFDIQGATISYEEIIATLGNQRLLVLFWYQTGHKTTTNNIIKKFNAVVNYYAEDIQDNAFVRVTVPITEQNTIETAREMGASFIRTSYPVFLNYIDSKTHSQN